MDDTARMIALLRRLKVEMNGAVVEAMQQRGIVYPLSYGVSVPTIQHIARECPAGHSLALLLFRQQVRELMLAAVYVDRPEWVTPDQMESWGRSLTNTEIVEQVASGLFAGAPGALPQALDWMGRENPWLGYAALLMAGKRLAKPAPEDAAQVPALLDAADGLLGRLDADGQLSAYMIRAGVTLLRRCAAVSPELKRRVASLNAAYAVSSFPSLRELSEELGWQLDYMD